MKETILVVEDNQPSRELLSDWLDVEGFGVMAAANLDQAYAAFKLGPPQAVLLDVQLGLEDGLSFASWIRKRSEFRNIPVIAVTAHAMVTDQERVIQAGCNACVSKPIDFPLLKRHLEICLPEFRFQT
jgi:two-component system, cell cycle response regulator DivK